MNVLRRGGRGSDGAVEPSPGMVIAASGSSDAGPGCLEGLPAQATTDGVRQRVAVVDNASTGDTVARILACPPWPSDQGLTSPRFGAPPPSGGM